MAGKPGQPRNARNGRFGNVHPWEPSPEEIRAACDAIQAMWSVEEEARRRGCRRIPDMLRGARNTEVERYRIAEVTVTEAAFGR